jgi:hypothetical protein
MACWGGGGGLGAVSARRSGQGRRWTEGRRRRENKEGKRKEERKKGKENRKRKNRKI